MSRKLLQSLVKEKSFSSGRAIKIQGMIIVLLILLLVIIRINGIDLKTTGSNQSSANDSLVKDIGRHGGY